MSERLLFVEFQRRHQSMQPDNLAIAGPADALIDIKQHMFGVFLQKAAEFYDPNKDTDFAKASEIVGMGSGLRIHGKTKGISLETARFLSTKASDQFIVYDSENSVVMKPNKEKKPDKPWFVTDHIPIEEEQLSKVGISKPPRLVLAATKLVMFKSGYPETLADAVGIPGENGKFLPLYEIVDGSAIELK